MMETTNQTITKTEPGKQQHNSTSQKITPFLWFDGKAEEAAKFYVSIFKNSKIVTMKPWGEGSPFPKEQIMNATFELDGQQFYAFDAGPQFKFNPSISFFVVCETEAETDDVWQKLVDGGNVMMALDKYDWSKKYGWLQDCFGISWQVSYGKISDVGQKFTPSLLFTGEQHGKAEAAVNFYTSVFDNSSITGILKYTAGENQAEGTVKHAQFSLSGQIFMAMESMPHPFIFNEAISFFVSCKTQEEIDYFWQKLTAEGGQESMCGWLKDKFGVSWQIVPPVLGELLADKDPAKAKRVMQAMMQMKKIIIADLEKAYEQV
jgi:predicted 3-demethylubiquinone-9 3-methyltransferase (glyoxalase superfamily)